MSDTIENDIPNGGISLPTGIEYMLETTIKWLVQHPLLLMEAMALPETPNAEQLKPILEKFIWRMDMGFSPLKRVYGVWEPSQYYYYAGKIRSMVKEPVLRKFPSIIHEWNSAAV
jgi:hypothetical protein